MALNAKLEASGSTYTEQAKINR